MRKTAIIFSLFLALLQVSTASGENREDAVLEGVRSKYRQLPGLEVPYTREVITRSMSMMVDQAKGDLASGRIYFRPPDSLRLEQESPREELIVTNGQTLWWYIPGEARVYRYAHNQFGKELTVLSDIFKGLSRAEEDFKVRVHHEEADDGFTVNLTPDPPWQEIEKIILKVSKDHNIKMVEVYNQVGGKTRFMLGETQKRSNFEEGFFEFNAPPDIRVIEEQPQ